jgi:hypothetical protein
MESKDDFPVSGTDALDIADDATEDRPRQLGEFKPTNSPLSKTDLDRRVHDPAKKQNQGWVPRSTGNIGELTPIPDDRPAEK